MRQPPAPGRPRPVADPVVDALAEGADEVARRWLVALVQSRPLEAVGGLPVAELAASGPELCRAVLDAVGSDAALASLAGTDVPADFARACGDADGPALVSGAEALRRAVLAAAADELPPADAVVLADLSDRLAHVCAQLAVAAMEAGEAARGPRATGAGLRDRAGESLRGEDAGEAAPRPAVRVAEPPREVEPAPDENDLGSRPVEFLRPRPVDDEPGPPLWVAALERQLADGGRVGLLLIELDGADRLRLAEGEDAARDLFARAGRAVRGALRRADLLAHEPDGRMWVVAPDAGRPGVAALAARVAEAVESAAASRGVPLTASVGLALFPDDGRDAASLTAQAEEAALAARASGVRIAGGPDDPPAAHGPRLVQ